MGSRLPDSIGSINWTFRLARASALLESSSGVLRKPNSVAPLTWRCRSFLWDRRCRWPRATYPETVSAHRPKVARPKAGRATCVSPPYLVLLRMGFTVPRTVTGRAVRSYRTLSPLPTPLGAGGLLSVALSVASPRLAVSEHAARRSSDFPPLELPCGNEERSPGALRRWTYSTVR